MATETNLRKNGQPKSKPGPKSDAKSGQKPVFKSKGSGKNVSFSIGDRLRVVKTMEKNNWSQKVTAKHFSKVFGKEISQANVSRWSSKKAEMLAQLEKNPMAEDMRRVREVDHPALEAALVQWMEELSMKGGTLTGPAIVEKARRLCDRLKISAEFTRSNGWLASFKTRHGLRQRKLNGEAASADPESAEEERNRLRPILAQFAPHDRFNVDESGFFFRQLYSYALGSSEMSGKKLDKTRVTILVGTNQTGTEKLKLLFIGKAAQPRCFQKKTPKRLGLDYHANTNAWMTAKIFQQWLYAFDRSMGSQGRKVLLLIDNFSGHQWEPRKLKNVQIEPLKPNLTAHVQPMDAGIIRTLKAIYKRTLIMRSIDREEAGEADIFKIDLLEAIRTLERAWDSVSVSTIANCWRHTGITPESEV